MPKQLTIEQAAYLAGFFDGEGSIIRVNWNTNWPGYRIVIYQSDEAIIRWIAEVLGTGSVNERIASTSNLPPAANGYKRQFFWQLYGHNAAAVLRQLLPYLRIKRDKALEAIEVLEAQRAAKQPAPLA